MEETVSETDESDASQTVERLAAVPERIRRAVASWSDERLRTTPADGEWSASDILAHLRASDAILAPRVLMMLARDNPPMPAFDERRWAEVAGYAERDFASSLAVFAGLRAELVAALRRLAPDDWHRTGMHETRGQATVLVVARGLVDHEEEHCAQLEALAAPAAPGL